MPNSTDAKIGLKIRDIRNKKRLTGKSLTAKALSLKLGWPEYRVSRIELAEIPITVRDIITIAEALEVSPSEFLED